MDGVILAPAHLIRSFFILASIAALSVNAIPILRQRFLLYGSRQADVPSGSKSVDISNRFLDALAKLQVPHSWFIHFYIASVASSLIWAYQIVTNGVAFQYIASFAAKHEAATCSMTVNQIAVTWALMTLQGCRRLYECCTLGKPSQAKMPIVSWVLGIAFYIAVGLSVWIEGIPALASGTPCVDSLKISKPSIKTWIAVPLFVYASGVQHDCHEHLASLKKYSLPNDHFFKWLLCPHYTAECVVYVALAIVSAPGDHLLNGTMATALVFTFTNLALTAKSSKEWYVTKFGAEKVKGRWRMVPFIF